MDHEVIMFKPNMILQSIKSGIKCKVLFISPDQRLIQVEYLDKKDPQYQGLFTYPLNVFKPYWVEVDYQQNEKVEINNQKIKEMYLKQCDHDWKNYIGLKDTFEYCSKCDKKRNFK